MWGSSTGSYSSGFEEEFIRARDRRVNTGEPEIWLYFRAIDEESAKDPGEQLTKVLGFRQEQIQRKEFLFKEFKNPQEWQDLIYDHLNGYILDLAQKEPKPTAPEQSIVLEQTTMSSSAEEIHNLETGKFYPTQVEDLFEKLNKEVAKNGRSVLDFWDRTRLLLLTQAWFSEVHSGEILGGHEINLVYRKRDWELSSEEKGLLFRSIIGDSYNIRPGWYWFRDWEDKGLDDVLSILAVEDADLGYQPSPEVLEQGLHDTDDQVVLQTIRLLKASEQRDYLGLLTPLIESNQSLIRNAAITARIEILYRENPNAAFAELIDSKIKIPNLLLATIDGLNLKVDNELLLRALDDADASVRAFVARYLRQAKMLSKEICEKLLKDTHANIRKEGLLGLVELGEDIDKELVEKVLPKSSSEADEVIFLILQKRDPQELLSSIDWYTVDGYEAYRVIAIKYFELLELRIRSDLDQKFETLRLESEERLLAKYGETAKQIFEVREKEVTEFIRAKYISAALAGLVQNGQPEDIRFARIFLGTTHLKIADQEAIRLIAKFGDTSDAEKLLQVASTLYGETKFLAVKTALKLSPGMDGILSKMLDRDDKEISTIIAQELLRVQSPQSIELAKELILNEDENLRLEGLAVLVQYFEKNDLKEILDEYLTKQTYYYNVVTWLDRYLFAPGRYSEFFQRQLVSKLPALDN